MSSEGIKSRGTVLKLLEISFLSTVCMYLTLLQAFLLTIVNIDLWKWALDWHLLMYQSAMCVYDIHLENSKGFVFFHAIYYYKIEHQ